MLHLNNFEWQVIDWMHNFLHYFYTNYFLKLNLKMSFHLIIFAFYPKNTMKYLIVN